MFMEFQQKENTVISHLERKLAETKKAINNMLKAIEQGIITTSTKQRLDSLEDKHLKMTIFSSAFFNLVNFWGGQRNFSFRLKSFTNLISLAVSSAHAGRNPHLMALRTDLRLHHAAQ